jgi:hypothetical protein
MIIFWRLFKLGMIYSGALVSGFAIYVALFRSPLFADISILFYRGTFLALTAALLVAILFFFTAKRVSSIDLSSAVGAVMLSLSFNICFLVLFPVTIDRSVTVFLLSRIDASGHPVSERELQQIFESEYLGQMQQIHRRVKEQRLSGNIEVSQGKIALTSNGKRFLSVSRTIGSWFGTDSRFVNDGTSYRSEAAKKNGI